MKVLNIVKYYHPSKGGMESYVKQLCEGMSKHGIEASVLTIRSNRGGKSCWELIDGINVRRSKNNFKIMSQPVSFSFNYELIKLSRLYDIIHVHSPFPNAEILSPFIRKKRLLVTWCVDPIETRWRRIFFIYRPFVVHLLKKAHKILLISPHLKMYSPTIKPFLYKCETITLSFRSSSNISRDHRARKVPKNPPRILFVGNLREYKGVSYLIRAIQNVHSANLIIVGQGEQYNSLKKLTRDLDLTSRVFFYSCVSDFQLNKLYMMADLFVLPSINAGEAFGIVQLEAMHHGLPVINTKLRSGAPFISIDGETGLTVPPQDETALANAINKILGDHVLYKRFSNQAILRAEKFDEKIMIESYVKVYEES